MTTTVYEKLDCVGNLIKIPITSHQVVVFPTDDASKLPAFNEYIDNGSHTGFSDVTLLAKSYDEASGLFWMSRPYIVILDDTFKFIYVYQFTERPKSIEVDAEGGEIVELIVHTTNCLCWKSRISHCAPTRDTDSDGCPDCLDLDYATSIKSLFRAASFNFDWQIKYALSSSVITNDFSIAAGDIDIFPFGVSGDNDVFDASGNILVKSETVSTETGDVDIYDIKSLSEIRVRDAPGNNAGDVVVYDVVGETKTRVTSTDHVFVGNCEISNGIVKIILMRDGRVTIYVWDEEWINQSPSAEVYPAICNAYHVIEISPDRCYVYVSGIGADSVAFEDVLNIKRGAPTIGFDCSYGRQYIYSDHRFMLVDDMLYDAAILAAEGTSQITPDSIDFPQCVLFGSSLVNSGIVNFASSPSTDVSVESSTVDGVFRHFKVMDLISGAVSFEWGALPISPIYVEAEAMTGGTGIEDAAAYPGTGTSAKRIATQAEYLEKTYVVGTDIDVATHKLFVRAKDSTQVADDFEVSVYDVTGEADILAASAHTLTATYDHVTDDFTLTSAMNGHTIRIRLTKATATTNNIDADYCLAVRAADIEKEAKRSLVATTTTKSILKLPR